MSTRKLGVQQPQSQSPFLLAPTKSPSRSIRAKLSVADLDWQLPASKSPKGLQHHRKTSELPRVKPPVPSTKKVTRMSHKSSPRSTSPKSPFSDLNEMIQFLSSKLAAKKRNSPYGSPKHRLSPVLGAPRQRKSSKMGSPVTSQKVSFAFPKHIAMEVESGVVKSPRIYENQIFRDVYDAEGNNDKVLYSSYGDTSLEIYQETKQKKGSVMTFAPVQEGRKKNSRKHSAKKEYFESDSGKAPENSKIEEQRESFKNKKVDFGDELLRKLSLLQEMRSDSQSETACEECKDSRKQMQVASKP